MAGATRPVRRFALLLFLAMFAVSATATVYYGILAVWAGEPLANVSAPSFLTVIALFGLFVTWNDI